MFFLSTFYTDYSYCGEKGLFCGPIKHVFVEILIIFVPKFIRMKLKEHITIQSLYENSDVQIGYFDNDIAIVDSIQRFAEVQEARVDMNAVVICTDGKIQVQMNGQQLVLQKNQVAIIPEKITVTDVMVTPDFDMKAMFLTNRILQNFLHERINVWYDMMYVHRLHIISLQEGDLVFYTHFYDMLQLSIERGQDNPMRTEVIQALLRAAIFALCGSMAQMVPTLPAAYAPHTPSLHFQRFLDLLHHGEQKRRSVEEYAGQLCITPKYLSAICKKHSGKTANEWIRDQVLEDIRYYLKQTDLSIKMIADKLGFPNASFFGRYVKEHFGMTPLQLRRQ